MNFLALFLGLPFVGNVDVCTLVFVWLGEEPATGCFSSCGVGRCSSPVFSGSGVWDFAVSYLLSLHTSVQLLVSPLETLSAVSAASLAGIVLFCALVPRAAGPVRGCHWLVRRNLELLLPLPFALLPCRHLNHAGTALSHAVDPSAAQARLALDAASVALWFLELVFGEAGNGHVLLAHATPRVGRRCVPGRGVGWHVTVFHVAVVSLLAALRCAKAWASLVFL